eukprot:COSAG05_NODE_17788_length_319_cov_0.695455_1_plen_69_part_01
MATAVRSDIDAEIESMLSDDEKRIRRQAKAEGLTQSETSEPYVGSHPLTNAQLQVARHRKAEWEAKRES